MRNRLKWLNFVKTRRIGKEAAVDRQARMLEVVIKVLFINMIIFNWILIPHPCIHVFQGFRHSGGVRRRRNEDIDWQKLCCHGRLLHQPTKVSVSAGRLLSTGTEAALLYYLSGQCFSVVSRWNQIHFNLINPGDDSLLKQGGVRRRAEIG